MNVGIKEHLELHCPLKFFSNSISWHEFGELLTTVVHIVIAAILTKTTYVVEHQHVP